MKKKQKSKVDLKTLTPMEEEIMCTVWELGECNSGEVHEAHKKVRKLAPTTIRTVLGKLLEKGYVERIPTIERGYRLKPTVSREAVADRLVSRIISSFYGGSPHLLVANLLNDDDVDEETLHEIEDLLNKRLKGNEE